LVTGIGEAIEIKIGVLKKPLVGTELEFAGTDGLVRKRRGEGKPETFDFLGYSHISGKNRLGWFSVRRLTVRKRMRAKLRQIKQQLRLRMHDPVPDTGAWLKSVVRVVLAGANTACPGNACSSWETAGFLVLLCSIPILQSASPPTIRDKNRMRF